MIGIAWSFLTAFMFVFHSELILCCHLPVAGPGNAFYHFNIRDLFHPVGEQKEERTSLFVVSGPGIIENPEISGSRVPLHS